MPYIDSEKRLKYGSLFQELENYVISDPGELNYLITNICLDYLFAHSEKYQIYNDIVGALEAAKLEFYRRQVSDYENEKIKINGDVY